MSRVGNQGRPPYKRGRFPVPAELKQLVNRYPPHGRMKQVSAILKMNPTHLGKLYGGIVPTSQLMRQRIKEALNGKIFDAPVGSGSHMTKVAKGVDPMVQQLLDKYEGRVKKAREAAGISDSHWYSIASGKKPVVGATKDKLKLALNGAANPATPTIVIGSVNGLGKPRKVQVSKYDKKDPPLIKQLVEKFGTRGAAAAAIGYTSPFVLNAVSSGEREMEDKLKAKIEAALQDKPQPTPGGDDLDHYTLGVALVICQGVPSFERVYDTAMAMDLKWMFKVQKGMLWIGLARYPTRDKGSIFKRVCARDAVLIACP